ncbi:unnamed protein product [Cunninghamella blakesleeana]
MMFIKALGLSIFTLATLITAQNDVYTAAIKWGSNGQYVMPGNDTIGNQLQLVTEKVDCEIPDDNGVYQIFYSLRGETENRFVAVEGNKVTAKASNEATYFYIDNDAFVTPGETQNEIKAIINGKTLCWQVNDSTMLIEVAPCVDGDKKQSFLITRLA